MTQIKVSSPPATYIVSVWKLSVTTEPDWDPRDPNVLGDYLAACDRMRERCPVAASEFLGWSVFRHADVRSVLTDHETFSSAVSPTHPSVPNGMDPPRHTGYRTIIDAYFGSAEIRAFEPTCREIAVRGVEALSRDQECDLIRDFAEPFALNVQCAFVGWPISEREALGRWVRAQHDATLRRDRAELNALAAEFDRMVLEQLEVRRSRPGIQDSISRLLGERLREEPLDPAAICSILRNWTVGELGTITASLGILVHHLARDRDLQSTLRAEPSGLPYAIEEILRMQAPLLTNRRVASRACRLGERSLEPGDKVTVMWAGANRDPEVFSNPNEFRWGRDLSQSSLYGAGIHVCPGAPLARLELKVAMEEILGRTDIIRPGLAAPTTATYPSAGFQALPVELTSGQSS